MRLFNPTRRFFRIVPAARIEPDRVVVQLQARRKFAHCPCCRRRTHRIHSHYTRKAWDLPCIGRPVRLLIHTRKFFCVNTRCQRKIFAERFTSALAPYARQTDRAKRILLELAHLGSAENGARVARLSGFRVSPDTLIRTQRLELFPEVVAEALGIDEFSWRKGQRRYGAITVDLMSHRPIDLLPTDSVDEVRPWLEAQPQVKFLARDRDAGLALATRKALPHAIQVADRFHLVHNVHDAFQTFVDSRRWPHPGGTFVAEDARPPNASPDTETPATPTRPTPRKQELWERVHHLRGQGHSLRQIARTLRIARATACKYAARSEPVAYPRVVRARPIRTQLESFMPYLRRRWFEDGVHNISQLYQEVRDQGFKGGLSVFGLALRHWRNGLRSPPPPPDPWPSARRLLLFTRPERWVAEERRAVETYLDAHPALAAAFKLRERLASAVRGRDVEGLLGWIEEVKRSRIPPFRSLARGLQQDLYAVRAALLLPWSNGQTEGQINRLKVIKRQGYGRAKPDLLRVRVLHRSVAA